LNRYKRGEICEHFAKVKGEHLERAPRIAVVGRQGVGKSDFSNSLIMALYGMEEYVEFCKLGTKDAPGTYRFDGPLCFLQRNSEIPKSVLFELYDTAGFYLTNVDEDTETICKFVLGEFKPNSRLISNSPDDKLFCVKRIQKDTWGGVDMVIIVAKSPVSSNQPTREETNQIDYVVALHNQLEDNSVNSLLVLTHSTETTSKWLTDNYGNLRHYCVDNYARRGKKEENNLAFLKLIGDIIESVELTQRPIRSSPNISLLTFRNYLSLFLFILFVVVAFLVTHLKSN